MSIDTTEKRFEQDIETFLLSEAGGYTKGDNANFDKAKGLDLSALVAFIKATQPKSWARYETVYNGNSEQALYQAFNDKVNKFGLIYTLRNKLEDRGVKLNLAYFAPTSSLNPELTELYGKNILTVTRQFRYSAENSNSIDMVLSLNGIPLVALELKNQLTGQNIDDSKIQFMHDRDPKENCFGFNKRFLVYFAVDHYEAWMTTKLAGCDTRFLPFNEGSNGAGEVGGAGNPAGDGDGYVTAYLWERVLQKDMLMRILQRYIFLEVKTKTETKIDPNTKERKKTKKTTKAIIFPRYHQLDVVEKLVADVAGNGSGKNYLIQHSAGSGKSNSIAWLAHKIQSIYKDEGRPQNAEDKPIFSSVIVVTDRKVLDRQLQDTIAGIDHVAGVVVSIDDKKTSQDLKDAINDGKKIIITTLQKFPVIYEQVDSAKGKNYAIIVDEAHSSQTGSAAKKLKKALADTSSALVEYEEFENEIDGEDMIVKEVLSQGSHKNLSFFAFTATPKPKTLRLFGEPVNKEEYKPFHVYSMRQAIEEGFILDVLQNYTTVEHFFKIAKATNENKEYKETPAIKAILKYYELHEKSIDDRVALIVEQFRAVTLNKIDGKAKAMVVCPSRLYAVKFYQAVVDYIKKRNYYDINPVVAFSGKVEIGEGDSKKEYSEAGMNKTFDGKRITESQLPEYFAGDEFNTLIVADKYQTGFDEPRLHTMFIMKRLASVKAVQTLSRVNRTYKGKVDTFIMDFANTAEDIQKAFQPFYEDTRLQGDFNINHVYDTINKIKEYVLFNNDDVERFIKIYSKSGEQTASDLGKITALFKPVVDRFNELSEEQRADYKDLVKSFNKFYAYITQLIRMFDKDLHKTYLFCEYLAKLLPHKKTDKVNLDDKVRLEFTNLKETFSGSIELVKGGGEPLKPQGDKSAALRAEKIDLLQNIVDKINIMFDGKFDEGDRVIVETIYNRIIAAGSKHLKKQAKNTTVEMFTESIFPKTFADTAEDCFNEHTEAFTKLFQNKEFFEKVMKAMGNALYSSLRQ